MGNTLQHLAERLTTAALPYFRRNLPLDFQQTHPPLTVCPKQLLIAGDLSQPSLHFFDVFNWTNKTLKFDVIYNEQYFTCIYDEYVPVFQKTRVNIHFKAGNCSSFTSSVIHVENVHGRRISQVVLVKVIGWNGRRHQIAREETLLPETLSTSQMTTIPESTETEHNPEPTVPSEASDDYNPLQCQICLHTFNTSVIIPRILTGCGHTVCQKCASSMVNGTRIVCPFDRIDTKVQGGVKNMPKNYTVLEVLQNSQLRI